MDGVRRTPRRPRPSNGTVRGPVRGDDSTLVPGTPGDRPRSSYVERSSGRPGARSGRAVFGGLPRPAAVVASPPASASEEDRADPGDRLEVGVVRQDRDPVSGGRGGGPDVVRRKGRPAAAEVEDDVGAVLGHRGVDVEHLDDGMGDELGQGRQVRLPAPAESDADPQLTEDDRRQADPFGGINEPRRLLDRPAGTGCRQTYRGSSGSSGGRVRPPPRTAERSGRT